MTVLKWMISPMKTRNHTACRVSGPRPECLTELHSTSTLNRWILHEMMSTISASSTEYGLPVANLKEAVNSTRVFTTTQRLTTALRARAMGILFRFILVYFCPAYNALATPKRAFRKVANTRYSKQRPKSLLYQTWKVEFAGKFSLTDGSTGL